MDYSQFSELFSACLQANHMDHLLNDALINYFHQLTVRMLQVNRVMNLTRITEPQEIILRHYIDSLTLSPHIPAGASVLDVGCGAGFPSLPLAIARPDLKITALDSTDKKVRYINETAAFLGIPHTRLHAVTARAEDAAAATSPMRESYDVVTSRAVARLQLLAELSIPFLRVGGLFIAMKGGRATEELSEATCAYHTLGAPKAELFPCTIASPPGSSETAPEEHVLVIAKKVRKTAEIHPRKYAQMLKKPL
ncbi:MAG: 16S rRNA (guanine(527)-N(7))-methyltransferase RsmG [Clostridia bacterium]|nr:16S rRNA (guanine(527)-N(7))-methyltransferase RsmG [Clostridia bacterium]